MQHQVTVSIDPAHPALEGHFPGNPVVPAVVILGKVFEVLRKVVPQPIQVVDIPYAKFVSPLKPGEPITIRLESNEAQEVMFSCQAGSRLISNGSLKIIGLEATTQGRL